MYLHLLYLVTSAAGMLHQPRMDAGHRRNSRSGLFIIIMASGLPPWCFWHSTGRPF